MSRGPGGARRDRRCRLYDNTSILRCRYGASRPHHDIPVLVDLYLAGHLKLDELVSRTYPLDAIATAFDDIESGRLARGVLEI